MWNNQDIVNVLNKVVEELCGDWKSYYKNHIEEFGFNFIEEREEFDEWREEYSQYITESVFVGKIINNAIKCVFGKSYDEEDLWELHLDIQKELKSQYDGWYGDCKEYTPESAFECMIQDYLKEHQDEITLTDLAEWAMVYDDNNDDLADDIMKTSCHHFLDVDDHEYKNVVESLKITVQITAKLEEYDTSDREEAEEYIFENYITHYNKRIEAPLIKFQASCRRITEIWRYVRTMNELCSRGCGNWR